MFQPSVPVKIYFGENIRNVDEIKKRLNQLAKKVKGLKFQYTGFDESVIDVFENGLREGVLGQAQIFSNGRGEIGYSLLSIDQQQIDNWALFRSQTVQINVVIHEICHALGLGHTLGTAYLRRTTPIMNASVQLDNNKIDYDMIQGLRQIYDTKKERTVTMDCAEGYAVLQHKRKKKLQFSRSFTNGQLAVSNIGRLRNWRRKIFCD